MKGESMSGSIKAVIGTILVVDDNESVLSTVSAILEAKGFDALLADCAAKAIEIAGSTDRYIDLLLSDVSMPNMSGVDLGQFLKKERPDLRVMLMSGGEDGALLVLNYGWAFIKKPFLAGKAAEDGQRSFAFKRSVATWWGRV